VVEGAREPLKTASLLERCEIVGGDMFGAVPAGGDAYLLSRIMHGWNDDRAVVILANCRRVMGPQSKLLVA
jgi:O-methyltransferase domain